MIRVATKALKNMLPIVLYKQKELHGEKLLYFTIYMNKEELEKYEENKNLIETISPEKISVQKIIEDCNVIFIGDSSSEKETTYIKCNLAEI